MSDADTTIGLLALVGGQAWHDGCTFDAALLDAAAEPVVTVVPTAAAYERPELRVERATAWFEAMGATVRVLEAYGRTDALDEDIAGTASESAFLYLCGGSPMHLMSVLKRTPLWDAILGAWRGGAVLAGSGAGADVLCDPMVDPRGGAFTVGLGVLRSFSIIPRSNTWNPDTIHRTVRLTAPGHVIVALPEQTALLRSPDGSWRTEGIGEIVIHRDGDRIGVADLDGIELGD